MVGDVDMKIMNKFVLASVGGAVAGYFISKGVDSIFSNLSFDNPILYIGAGLGILYILKYYFKVV